MSKLTGNMRLKTRYRWFRPAIIVVQVEEIGTTTDYLAGHIETHDYKRWRDAQIDDYFELQLDGKALSMGYGK